MIMDIRTDRRLIRSAGQSHRYVLIAFTAPTAAPKDGRTPINVSFVLDRSGSMGGEKIRLVRQAVEKALTMLRPEDRFSIVVYDDRIDVLAGSTLASGEAKRNAWRQLSGIDARGSTNLSSGWLTGCEQLSVHLDDQNICRCLLLTDGLANQGITDHSELIHHAGELKKRLISTSTFGVGTDFDERLLQEMATAGGGHSYYIERNIQIVDFLTSELGEALEVVAREAAVELVVPSVVRIEPLSECVCRGTGNSMRVELGDVVSGQEISLVLKLEFPRGKEGEELSVDFCLSDRNQILDAPPVTIAWSFAGHEANDAQPRDLSVDRAVAELYAARARDEALKFNRSGRYAEAQSLLRKTADRIAEYAGDDPEILGFIGSLRSELEEYAAPMEEVALKSHYYAAMNVKKSRTPEGKARRKN
jgi:Ca-activated chloride channel homolog